MNVEIKTIQLNDRMLTYPSSAFFRVQVGRGGGGYSTKYSFMGNPSRAMLYYNAINVGNMYKKRLVMDFNGRKEVLVKDSSW